MKTNYLSYAQASAICEDYQCLIGELFTPGDDGDGLIRQVVVAPYSRILQWKFIRSLLREINPQTAADICPNGKYDVLLLPDQIKRDSLNYRAKTVRHYLKEQGKELNLSDYNALRII